MQSNCPPGPKFNQVEAQIDLGQLGEDPVIQAALKSFLGTLRHGTQGFSGRLRITALPEEVQGVQPIRKAPIAGSPGDWYEHSDQMTVGERAGASDVWQ